MPVQTYSPKRVVDGVVQWPRPNVIGDDAVEAQRRLEQRDVADWLDRTQHAHEFMFLEGWTYCCDDAQDYMTARVYAPARRVAVSSQTWSTIAPHAPAFEDFLRATQEGGSGLMRFEVKDSGSYGEAARRQAEREGKGAVQAKDAITELMEHANALVVQAASLNTAATLGQLETFGLRLARLQEQYAALEDRLREAQALLDLAATAVVDAAS